VIRFLAVLLALLAGLAIGKAWERYKLRDGKWFDRRRAGESRHYMLGLNFLVANQVDLAIEELGRAASLDPDALEVHMVLGNLYREKGQVGKAITVHQTLLQRPRLTRLEHAYVLLGLGLVTLPLGNAFSRRIERQADDFALATTGNPAAFIGAMERLGDLNLAERRPNRLKELVLYSHPALDRRIARARGEPA